MTTSLRFGILSTAKIGRTAVIPALKTAPNCEVTAIASRELGGAQQMASELGIPTAYGSYDELLADPEVDAIYNPLPNHLHAPMTLAAVRAGKHVLCEKPLTLTATEAQQLQSDLATVPGSIVMEAFMYQFHPQWQAVFEIVASGEIGELRTVQTWFSYYNDDPANIRHNPAWGGGALMDIGCYAIHSARRLFGAEPRRAHGTLEVHPAWGVDTVASGILEFDHGHSTFTVSSLADPDQRVHVVGTKGRIEMVRPFNAWTDRTCTVRVGNGLAGELRELSFGPDDQYALMVEAFAAAALGGERSPVSLDDAIANMAVIDAIAESAAPAN